MPDQSATPNSVLNPEWLQPPQPETVAPPQSQVMPDSHVSKPPVVSHNSRMFGIPRRTITFIVLLTLFVVVLGWNYFVRPFAGVNQVTQTPTVTPVPTTSTKPQVADLTPEAAVAKLLAYPVVVSATASPTNASRSAVPAADLAWINEHQPAMVTLFGTRVSTTAAQLATQEIRQQYPDKTVVIAVDHEGGTTQRLNGPGFTTLPSWRELCAQDPTTSAVTLSNSLGEVKNVGVDMVLAPVVDVGSSAVLASRICSNDPNVVVANATKYVELARARGLFPVLKHFPGIGSTTRDLHTTFDRVTVTAADAQVYQQLLDKFASLAVMVTHVGVVNQFGEIPCSLSKDCVQELKQTYPQVLVMADALEMEAAGQMPGVSSATSSASLAQRAVAAVNAGNQLLIFGAGVSPAEMDEVRQALLNEYQTSTSFKNQVDLAAARVLELESQVKATQ